MGSGDWDWWGAGRMEAYTFGAQRGEVRWGAARGRPLACPGLHAIRSRRGTVDGDGIRHLDHSGNKPQSREDDTRNTEVGSLLS